MKITCSKAALATGVQTVYRAVSAKANIQELSGILVQTAPEGLRLVAYDLEMGIETFVPVVVEREGSFIFPAKFFIDIVRKLPHSEVIIEFKESDMSIEITSERADFQIKVMASSGFPKLPDINSTVSWPFAEKDFKNMIKKTSIATSEDSARPTLTGILMAISDRMMEMVATDSFRLAHRKMEFLSGLDIGKSVIIPAKVLIEVERNLSEDGERSVEIGLTDKHIIIKIGNTTYISRLLDGQFPNYRQVFHQNTPAHLTLDRLNFLSSIERVSLMSQEDVSSVKCTYHGVEGSASGFLTITANTPEIGKAEEEIPVSMEGHADITVALRAKYIKDILRVAEGDDVVIGFISSRHAIEIKDGADPDFTYLVMPITTV